MTKALLVLVIGAILTVCGAVLLDLGIIITGWAVAGLGVFTIIAGPIAIKL